MTDRAVSEIIGFVLIVSLILSIVGVVYAVGIGGLEDSRNAERVNNAERAFDVLADNLNDIHARDAPSRATEIKLADANLAFGAESEVMVKKDGDPTGYGKTLTPIVYDAGTDAQLVYENGAVIRSDGDNAVMLREPSAVFIEQNGERIAVMPIIETRPDGSSGGVSGTTTVLIRADGTISGQLQPDSWSTWNDQAVHLEMRTSATRAPVWEGYLESAIPDNWDPNDDDVCTIPSPDTVACDFETDEMYVTRTGIDVKIS